MGWAIAGGVLGLILMFGSYRWLTGWATARSGGVSIPMIGTRPRRLAGVPEEAPDDARMPPAMVVLRHGSQPLVVEPEPAAPAVVEAPPPTEPMVAHAAAEPAVAVADESPAPAVPAAEPGAASGVVVAAINQGSEDQGEFVLIANSGPNPVSLEGWRLTDEGDKHVYDFPAVLLASQMSVRVHMWRGEDTETDLYVGRRSRWWNNDGDTAYLYDAAGILVHSLSPQAESAPAADEDSDG